MSSLLSFAWVFKSSFSRSYDHIVTALIILLSYSCVLVAVTVTFIVIVISSVIATSKMWHSYDYSIVVIDTV